MVVDRRDLLVTPPVLKPQKGQHGEPGEQGSRGPTGADVSSLWGSGPALFDDITGIKHLWTSERACEPGPAVSDLSEGPVVGVCVCVSVPL